jgi:hypothetical protein
MKNLKQLFLLLVLMSMSGTKASAYNFSVENDDGVTIYYNYWGGNDVEVTYGDNSYSGNIVIPSSVTYNGNTYCVKRIGS